MKNFVFSLLFASLLVALPAHAEEKPTFMQKVQSFGQKNMGVLAGVATGSVVALVALATKQLVGKHGKVTFLNVRTKMEKYLEEHWNTPEVSQKKPVDGSPASMAGHYLKHLEDEVEVNQKVKDWYREYIPPFLNEDLATVKNGVWWKDLSKSSIWTVVALGGTVVAMLAAGLLIYKITQKDKKPQNKIAQI